LRFGVRGSITAFAALLLLVAPASAQVVIYDSNPRIIRVPDTHARHVAPAAHTTSDDEVFEQIERRRPQPRRSLAKPAAEKPRARAELPPPAANEPKRAVLSAPPAAVGPGSLTPIYPTPRWRNSDPPPPMTADNTE
jgi:hypothetical protein